MQIEQKQVNKFWSKVAKTPGGCWEWSGARDQSRYGIIRINGKNYYTHRLSMSLAGHDIAGLFVCHHCDNPPCVNPNHLFLGTHQDNMTDKMNKGRHKTNPLVAEKGSNAKLTNDQARAIRSEARMGIQHHKGTGNIGQLAERYNVNRSTIRNIAINKRFKNI